MRAMDIGMQDHAMKRALAVFFVAVVSAGSAAGVAAEASQVATVEGTWTTRARLDDDGDRHIQVSMELDDDRGNWGWWVEPDELQGLTFEQFDGNVDAARFELVREAGTVVFEGVVRNGRGSGTFAFTPDVAWRQRMTALGFDDFSTRQVFQAAIHDVRAAYVQELVDLGYTELATRDLFSFAIHRVTTDFIREMNALGYHDIAARQLITMRIHGVTADWVRRVRAAMGG